MFRTHDADHGVPRVASSAKFLRCVAGATEIANCNSAIKVCLSDEKVFLIRCKRAVTLPYLNCNGTAEGILLLDSNYIQQCSVVFSRLPPQTFWCLVRFVCKLLCVRRYVLKRADC